MTGASGPLCYADGNRPHVRPAAAASVAESGHGPTSFHMSTTNRPVPTGVKMDAKSLRKSWTKTLRLSCPHCGEVHEISVRETYIILGCHFPYGVSGLKGKRGEQPRHSAWEISRQACR
jgi:hypothetical protein